MHAIGQHGTVRLSREDLDGWLIRLHGSGPRALAVTSHQNLRVLGLDDRISTGRTLTDPDPLLWTCWSLSDAVGRWWPDAPTAIRYRSRMLPSSTDLAFPVWPGDVTAGRLGDARRLLTTLTLRHCFTLPPRMFAIR